MQRRALTDHRPLALGVALLAATGLTLIAPSSGAASNACVVDDSTPWVGVDFTGRPWSPSMRSAIVGHLRAGLGPQGLEVCRTDDGPERAPVARVLVSQDSAESVVITIDVRDGVTEKQVVRDVDLRELTTDSRALGVAIAADELLRASWVELALEDAPEPKIEPPPAVTKSVQRSLRRDYSAPSTTEAGARFAVEHYTGGQLHLGGDALLRQWFSRPFGMEIALGVRGASTFESQRGDIAGSALGASAGIIARPYDGQWLLVDLEASAWVAQVRLRGEATAGAVDDEGADVIVFARGGPAAGVALGSDLVLRLRAGAGAPLRSLDAVDGDGAATGASGLEIYTALGLSAGF